MFVLEYMIKYDDLLVRSELREDPRYTFRTFRSRLRADIKRKIIPHIVKDIQ